MIHARGYSLVEVLFVALIISVLSLTVYGTMGKARERARDAQRLSDIQMLQLALKMHRENYGTYLVSGTGQSNTGEGWISYQGGTYTNSITGALHTEGLIPNETVPDPTLGTQGYVLFLCDGGKRYALFARMERPTTTSLASGLCDMGTATGTPYNMNYGVGG